MESQIPVKVAVRCRPPSSIEESANCITFVANSPQVNELLRNICNIILNGLMIYGIFSIEM